MTTPLDAPDWRSMSQEERDLGLNNGVAVAGSADIVAAWERRSAEMRARYPLVSARVSVRERPGRPGVYGCVVLLQPHFQLDDVTASFRLVTDITAPGLTA